MSFESLGLTAALTRAVADQGYTEPTPVQAQAIPAVLAGRDLMAAAQTGTGKTAGFTLPLLQRLAEGHAPNGPRKVRALILAPTRELAMQVQESVRTYGRHLPLKSWAVFGGIGIGPQINALRRGLDILVATPGRLLDLMSQGCADLSGVEILVLDEADRMLDMGFIHDIRKVIAALPSKRQNLMFSATFAGSVSTLAQGIMTNPLRVQVAAENASADNVTHLVHPVDKGDKRAALSWLIGSNNWRQVLVFARTKHGADRLARQLETDGLKSAAIHGNKSQHQRTRALESFKRGAVRVLVATDVAARGLDIDHLPHVVNFELPNVPEDYVHRIGRTGRAGRDGTAVSLVGAEERNQLRDIEKVLGFAIERRPVEGFPDFSLGQAKGGPRKGSARPRAARARAAPGPWATTPANSPVTTAQRASPRRVAGRARAVAARDVGRAATEARAARDSRAVPAPEPRSRLSGGNVKPQNLPFRKANEALRVQPQPVLRPLQRACHSLRLAPCAGGSGAL